MARQLPKESKRFQVPAKARREVAEGGRRLQDVQREVRRRESLLSQLAAKSYTGSLPRVAVSKSNVRQKKISLLHVS